MVGDRPVIVGDAADLRNHFEPVRAPADARRGVEKLWTPPARRSASASRRTLRPSLSPSTRGRPPMNRRELSLGKVLLVYGLGILAGAQAGLYLLDTFDDGVSEPLSGVIALAFLALGFGVIAWLFRRTRAGAHS